MYLHVVLLHVVLVLGVVTLSLRRQPQHLLICVVAQCAEEHSSRRSIRKEPQKID